MDFPVEIHLGGKDPLYLQLAAAIKDAVHAGRLRGGDTVPSTPQLAKQLNLSRSTVVKAYDFLLSQKILESEPGKETRVRPATAEARAPRRSDFTFPLSTYAQRLVEQGHEAISAGDVPEMNHGASALELLPIALWRQTVLYHCRTLDPSDFSYTHGEPLGHRPLREAIMQYCRRSRGVVCDVDQVAVFPGALHAVNMVARLLIDPGDVVAIENPGFPYAQKAFSAHGARLFPVPVDANGICVDQLHKVPPECKLIYVTPSHQDPTGGVLPLARRKALLEWASSTGTIVVEDDYDNEYRYEGAAIPSIQSMDHDGRVIYICTFWKTLFPISSAGYMIVPPGAVEAFARAEAMEEGHIPLLELYALTDFINQGHLERHIKKTKTAYQKRLHGLIKLLALHLRSFAEIAKQSSGTHLLIRFQVDRSDEELLQLATIAGLPMMSTATYYIEAPRKGEFIISFAEFDELALAPAIQKFAALLG